MTKIKKTIQSIIREIDDVNNQPRFLERREGIVELPSFISTGDGNTLLLNQSIDRKITELADYYFHQQNAIQTKYTINEWRSAIRNMVGRCYKTTDPNDSLEQRGHIFKQQIVNAKDEYVSKHNNYIHSFGCSLFRTPLKSEFTIGPVTFLPLNSWLIYAFEKKLIKETEYNSLVNFISHIERSRYAAGRGTQLSDRMKP